MNLAKLSDKELVMELADYGFTFVDSGGDLQRMEKAPLMVLSTKGGNTPLVRVFTFEFRWENPKLYDPAVIARKEHTPVKESVWVDFNFNLYLNTFEISHSQVKSSKTGIPVPAYRANTLLNRGMPVVLLTSGESINSLSEYDSLEDYKQKDFDFEIVGQLMAERIRRYLRAHDFHLTVDVIKDANNNKHLRHFLTDDQKAFVIAQIMSYISGERDFSASAQDVPHGEKNVSPDFSDLRPSIG